MPAAIADRQHDAGVAVVAGEEQDEGRDQADADRDEPRDAGELGHDGGVLSLTPMTAALTPALALDYLHALSADLRAAVVLDARGECLAGPPALADARARARWRR